MSKPSRWNVDPGLIAPKWQWAWRGLVAHYIMWEGGGRTLFDVSGNGNHGTFINDTSWVAADRGLAISLDGVNDYVERTTTPSLDITGELTLSAWIRMDNIPTPDSEGIVAKYRNQTGNANQRAYQMVIRTAGEIRATVSSDGTFSIDVTANQVDGFTDLTDHLWHHVAATFKPSVSFRIYADGLEEDSQTTSIISSIHNSPAPLWIGLSFDSTDSARYADALIDDVRIYNRTLSAEEIRLLSRDQFGPVRRDLNSVYINLIAPSDNAATRLNTIRTYQIRELVKP